VPAAPERRTRSLRAVALDNDAFAIYAELASTAAAFPAKHHAAMAGALAMSDNEAVREAALGFAFSPDPAVSSAAQAGFPVHRKLRSIGPRAPWNGPRKRPLCSVPIGCQLTGWP
jgi:hypothetical protein